MHTIQHKASTSTLKSHEGPPLMSVLSTDIVMPPLVLQMEGGLSARDSPRLHGGMSGESGQTGGVLHVLGVVASPHRALLLTGS